MVFPGKFESVMLNKSHGFPAFSRPHKARVARPCVGCLIPGSERTLRALENSSFFLSKIYYTYLHAMYHQFQYIDTNMKYRRIALILICHHMSSYVNNHTRSKYPMDAMEKSMDWIWDQPPPGARRGHQRWRLDAFRPFRPFRHLVAQLKLDCLGVVFFNKKLENI